MSNEDVLVKTLINKHKKHKHPNKQPQINKVVIDYDQVVIALPHFPKPTKIRINGPKTLVDITPKRKKTKKLNLDGNNDTQMETSVIPNGVDDFDPKPCSSDCEDEPLEGLKNKKKKKKNKKNETQMGKGVCSNGVDDFEGLNKVVKRKRGLSVGGKEESVECKFPVNRIVRIIKSQGDDYKLGHEAVFLINKATEKFIELFSEDAYDCAFEEKKSFVGYKHLSAAAGKEKRLEFLSDFVPEKITAEKALAGRKSAETLPLPS